MPMIAIQPFPGNEYRHEEDIGDEILWVPRSRVSSKPVTLNRRREEIVSVVGWLRAVLCAGSMDFILIEKI